MVEACCSCEDIKGIVREIVKELFDEKLAKLTTQVKTRTKRAPSAYNIFIGKCMKGDGKTMKQCAVDYKKQKKEAK